VNSVEALDLAIMVMTQNLTDLDAVLGQSELSDETRARIEGEMACSRSAISPLAPLRDMIQETNNRLAQMVPGHGVEL
jgi:hypothetical protein